MARRIKRFFVFLFFSLFFSLLSGRGTDAPRVDKKGTCVSGETKKVTVWGLNSARAEDEDEPCYDDCCPEDD